MSRGLTALLLWTALFPIPDGRAATPHQLRVLSYNIHHGAGTDGKLDLERIAKVIRSAEPDVVALQEVDRGTRRTQQVDQPAELGRLTGMRALFERNLEFEGGEYGNAVLSRLPVVTHKNHYLPSHYVGEQRGALAVEMKLTDRGPNFLLLATHLDYRPNDAERRASVKLINNLVQQQPQMPTLLVGDLNSLPDAQVMRDFDSKWNRTTAEPLPTFPAGKPVRQIDYVLYRPANRWRVIEARVIDESAASDHRPLLVVLELVVE